MRYKVFILLIFPLFVKVVSAQQTKQPIPLTRILFVFDASQSMYGRWQSDMKITIAQRLLVDLLDSLTQVKNLELALRVYGHQKIYPPQDCDDTRLEVPFSAGNIPIIKHRIQTLIPSGTTPIARSLEEAAKDFPPCSNCRNIIILITDGIEECDGDPCAVSQMLQKQGVILKPFIIGIGSDFRAAFECMGTYFDASNEQTFRRTLNVVISQALNSTSAQVNLLDEKGKPTETNVNMTFYDQKSGKVKYNYIHTLNYKGLPDTLRLDPLCTYSLVVHTIPPVRKDSIVLSPGKHTYIGLDAPQGYLDIEFSCTSSMIKNVPCIIRKKGASTTLNVQYTGQKEKYITGLYEIEVLTLPRLLLKEVSIKQSSTTTITIPLPGTAILNHDTYGYGSLYSLEGSQQTWIYNFREDESQEILYLQPGFYRAIFRSKYTNNTIMTIEKDFEIKSGITTRIDVMD